VHRGRRLGSSHGRSRVADVALLTITLLAAAPLVSGAVEGSGRIASADEGRYRTAAIALTAEPDSAPVGAVITVTGSTLGGQGDSTWRFTVPTFVQRVSQHGGVLEVECRVQGTGDVTATYTDELGTAQASETVRCTAAEPPPKRSRHAPSAPSSTASTRGPTSMSPGATPEPTSAPSSPATPPPQSAPGPVPVPVPVDPLREKVDAAERQLEAGVVSYRPPPMREGEAVELVVRVQRASAVADPQDVPGEGPLIERPIDVGTPMTAQLIGETFDIQPVGAVPRVLGSTRPAEWSWTITPERPGKKELRLELAVLLDEVSGTPVVVKSYVEIIDVRVDLVRSGARIVKSATGVLGTAGLTVAAVAGAALSRWRRRRRADGAGGDDEDGHEDAHRQRRAPARQPTGNRRPRR
jgi:hypothetical protein